MPSSPERETGGPVGLAVLDHAAEVLDGRGQDAGHGQAGRQRGAVEAHHHAARDDGDGRHGSSRSRGTTDPTSMR